MHPTKCLVTRLQNNILVAFVLSLSLLLSGCVGTAIETVTDAAIAVAKVPFKVVGAAADVVSGDDDDDE
jgi:hypothetical protein